MSKDPVHFDVVDFVSCLGLEALVQDRELGLASLQLHIVEDAAESCHADEAAGALILILEEGLDQKAVVAHMGSKAHHAVMQALLLSVGQHVLGVQDGGRVKRLKSLCWVLLEVLLGKDVGDLLTEVNIVNKGRVCFILNTVVLLQKDVFGSSKLHLMGVEAGSKLGGGDDSLAENIVILEELEETDTVTLNNLLNLGHQFYHGLVAIEVDPFSTVGRVNTTVGHINNVGQWLVGILEEIGVLDLVLLVTVD